jgi:hypothetical protein
MEGGKKIHPETFEALPVHDFVRLLVARMESHPQEFYKYDARSSGSNFATNTHKKHREWSTLVESTKGLWNREEKKLYNIALRHVRMDEAYKRMLASLLT